jgi:hemolysin III
MTAVLPPRLRGVSHLYAFVVSLVAGTLLVALAPAGARLAATVYALGLSGMLGASALLHRGRWSPATYARLMKLDHSMIFVMIAASYTPVAALGIDGVLRILMLSAVWAVAVFGIVFEWTARKLPKGWTLTLFVTLGWVAVVGAPPLWHSLGVAGFGLLVAGGVLYTVGGALHAARRPTLNPEVFGYWEVFHLFVLAAVVCHYICIARYVLPLA